MKDRVEHRLVEQGVAHPLRDDYIDVLDTIREGDLFDFSADDPAFPWLTIRGGGREGGLT
jgi:hypothetical protein